MVNDEFILKSINEISLRGCLAYAIMCLEKYITELYPEKKWGKLFKHLWKITDESILIDDWDEKTCEILPDSIFEKNCYDNRFSILTEEEYYYYADIYKEVDENINIILGYICDMEECFSYTIVNDKNGILPRKVSSILNILHENNIDVPNIALVKFSKRIENNGRGKGFNGENFSIVL
ncbi:MAG: hypothetical protein PUB89_00390 [Oscillospiraceae bacterium]|nr:hypothetical protein [Oscillospiraceae bacterium]